eukprot:GHVO01053762.1.p1 GENE.GHVO01053762.1~~GHVO01053762.1.p1  ORF type:complete len:155 (-),score=3.33 GHVO01053762.1:74-538(-)
MLIGKLQCNSPLRIFNISTINSAISSVSPERACDSHVRARQKREESLLIISLLLPILLRTKRRLSAAVEDEPLINSDATLVSLLSLDITLSMNLQYLKNKSFSRLCPPYTRGKKAQCVLFGKPNRRRSDFLQATESNPSRERFQIYDYKISGKQ